MKKKNLWIAAALAAMTVISACSPKSGREEVTDAQSSVQTQGESAGQDGSTNMKSEAADSVRDAGILYFSQMPEDGHKISVNDVMGKIDGGEDMVLIDVRQPDAYSKGHLKGAYNIPYGNSVAEALTDIPDNVPVYVNCYTGQTGSQVTALLNMAGKKAWNIQGGWNNGISKTDGYESYSDTAQTPVLDGDYQVDGEIANAVADYFKEAAGSRISLFNFSSKELRADLDKTDRTYGVVSVQSPEDFQKGHIDGALSLPFAAGMEKQLDKIPEDREVVVTSRTGQTSSQVMAVLRMMGYQAYSLSGGIDGWIGSGNELTAE